MPDGRSSTGQVAIHAVLLPRSYKVLIFGRNLPKSGPKSIPEPRVGGNVSVVFDVSTGDYVVTPNYETLFCAGHTTMPDGQVLAAGGDPGVGYSWMREGRDVVRLFDPASMAWKTLPGVKLSEPRWYPTQVTGPSLLPGRSPTRPPVSARGFCLSCACTHAWPALRTVTSHVHMTMSVCPCLFAHAPSLTEGSPCPHY